MKLPVIARCAILGFATTAYAQPVLRYNFDEASGNALDTGAAPATDATFEGGATRSTDTPSGSGMSLDLRTDADYAHLLGPDAPDLDGLTSLTLTTWLKVESYPSTGSNNKRLLAKQAAGTTFPGFSFNMNAVTNNLEPAAPDNFRLGFFAGSSTTFSSGFSDVDAGAAEWTFIAATFDSALGEIKFYTGDGDSPATQLGSTIATPPESGPVDGVDARFAVGLTDAANTFDTSVTGWQDDVRVYASVLDLAALDAVRLENLSSPVFFDGDFNEDGKVDGDDLTVWKTGFGTTGTATHKTGDADDDLDVDGVDLLEWQRDVGAPFPIAAAVPEPASGVLLILAAVAAASVARRR